MDGAAMECIENDCLDGPQPHWAGDTKATPGTLVEATTPEGFSVQVSIPMNVGPGDQFAVQY